MTYQAIEESAVLGRPFFLYEFNNGVTTDRYTSDPEQLTKATFTWDPFPGLSHSNLELSGNIEKQGVELTAPISNTFARSFLIPAARVTTVTIFRGHHSDPDNQLSVVWKGRVVGAKSKDRIITIALESVATSMRNTGCRVRYQRTCRFAVYFDGCNLDVNDWKVAATITAMNGLVLTVPEATASAFPNDYLGGMVIWDGLYGFVKRQSGTSLTLINPVEGLQDAFDLSGGSLAIDIAPGCRLNRDYCESRFANHLNFGGFPYMPDNNPFSISIV